jgi:hypothetical protein
MGQSFCGCCIRRCEPLLTISHPIFGRHPLPRPRQANPQEKDIALLEFDVQEIARECNIKFQKGDIFFLRVGLPGTWERMSAESRVNLKAHSVGCNSRKMIVPYEAQHPLTLLDSSIPEGRYLFLAGWLAWDVGADVGRRSDGL